MKGAVVYATQQGLGIQARQFYAHDLFQKALIHPHSSYTNHYDWYPDRVASFDELLDTCDTIYFFETPFDWKYITRARERGVKTVFFLMYECTHFPLPYYPDVLVGGSVMEREFFGENVHVINVPVPDELKWKQRTKARTFVHNAGHGGLGGRNGTKELLEAIPLVKSPAKFIIRSQVMLPAIDDSRVDVRVGDLPYASLFSEGDVFVYPDKFGGSCLPLQEAFASGMAVMASDRHPSNTWLPKEMLVPIDGYTSYKIYRDIPSAILSPATIAAMIDAWYDRDITHLSRAGKEWGKANSWNALMPLYEAL